MNMYKLLANIFVLEIIEDIFEDIFACVMYK